MFDKTDFNVVEVMSGSIQYDLLGSDIFYYFSNFKRTDAYAVNATSTKRKQTMFLGYCQLHQNHIEFINSVHASLLDMFHLVDLAASNGFFGLICNGWMTITHHGHEFRIRNIEELNNFINAMKTWGKE